MVPTIPIIDAWRQLKGEGSTTVGYHAVRYWVVELFGRGVTQISVARDPSQPSQPSGLELLRQHALLMQQAKGSQVKRNKQSKLALLKLIQQTPEPISGSWLLDVAPQYKAVSRSVLQRRGVRAKSCLSKDQARELILKNVS